MIEEYKYVNGKIIAMDDEEGLKEFDYQDNIDDVIKTKDEIEKIEFWLYQLKCEKTYLKTAKNVFYDTRGLVIPIVLLVFSTLLSVFGIGFIAGEFGSGTISQNFGKICALLSGLVFLSIGPSILYENNKYKKARLLKLANIEEQIKEFKKVLEKEQRKLKELVEDKTRNHENSMDNKVVKINVDSLATIKKINNKRRLYEFFRENCDEIKRYNDKEFLKANFGEEFSEEDINTISDMFETNKVLVKSRNNQNKKHN